MLSQKLLQLLIFIFLKIDTKKEKKYPIKNNL